MIKLYFILLIINSMAFGFNMYQILVSKIKNENYNLPLLCNLAYIILGIYFVSQIWGKL